jgi:hypothetical protein
MLNLISSPGQAGLCLVNTKGKAFIRNKTNKRADMPTDLN